LSKNDDSRSRPLFGISEAVQVCYGFTQYIVIDFVALIRVLTILIVRR
jgi:hypothetical protein